MTNFKPDSFKQKRELVDALLADFDVMFPDPNPATRRELQKRLSMLDNADLELLVQNLTVKEPLSETT